MNTSPTRSDLKRRLSPQDKQRLAADLAKQFSTADLARRYGVSRRAIQQFAAKIRGEGGAAATKVLSVRVDLEELLALDALAGRLGVTRAACARHALRRAAGFFDPGEDIVDPAREITRELKRIGTNLNQLVYHANRRALVTGRGEISEADLDTIVAMRNEVGEIASTISRLIVSKARSRKVMVENVLRGIGG